MPEQNSLVQIVKNLEQAGAAINRQALPDVPANIGDGFNATYHEYEILGPTYINHHEAWMSYPSDPQVIGSSYTLNFRRPFVDWDKMTGRYFVLIDRATRWTNYQLWLMTSFSNGGVPRSGGGDSYTPAYQYYKVTATLVDQAGHLGGGDLIYLKTPDFTSRTVGVASYAMSTPDTFAMTPQVDGHQVSIASDDISLTRPGFYLWQVEQADDTGGSGSQVLIYGPSDLPAIASVAPGTTKYYRARSVSILGDFSSWTSWSSAITYTSTPAQPAWISHTFQTTGHLVTWSAPIPADVDYFVIYRNSSASDSGATTVGTAARDATSYLIPYAAGGDYFGIRAIGYGGAHSGTNWDATDYTPTPGTPANSAVNLSEIGGWIVSWDAEFSARFYEVQGANDGAGTGAATLWTGNALVTPTLRSGSKKYFRVRATGWDGNASSWTSWATDTNAPPQPTIQKITEDYNTVTIFMASSDTSHTSVGFSHYKVEVADDSSGTNSATVDASAPYGESLSYPLSSTGLLKYYRLTPYDLAGNAGTATAWTGSTYKVDSQSIKDLFDNYGGNATSALDSLYWLSIEPFETTNGWIYTTDSSPISLSTTCVEGQYSASLPNAKTQMIHYLSTPIDFTAESRFTDDDYFVMAVYMPATIANKRLSVILKDVEELSYYKARWDTDGMVVGWNYLKAKRSDWQIFEYGGSGWAAIGQISVASYDPAKGALTLDIFVDDLRIVKADPNDATTYNDTGGAWEPMEAVGSNPAGEWHIYPGNRSGEPAKPFSLGHLNNSAHWRGAYLANSDIYTGTVQTGYYRKAGDLIGLGWFISDTTAGSWDMYSVSMNRFTVHLRRWTNGAAASLVIVNRTETFNTPYWIGVDLREFQSDPGRIKVYVSSVEGNLIQASNLVISYKDTSPLTPGGKVGVVTYRTNARFFDFTAGSPAHAEVADVARALDGPMVDGQDGSKRVFLSAANDRLEWSQDRSTWADILPLGAITQYAGATAPGGWLLCYGQAISRTTYAGLFTAIGTAYGTGDGSTTFNLPDLRGRGGIGLDNMGGISANRVTDSAADSLGGGGGAETHTLTTGEMPAHTHGVPGVDGGSSPGFRVDTDNTTAAYANTLSAGSGGAHNNMQPWLAVNYIIFTGV